MYESAYMDDITTPHISQKAQKIFTTVYFLCADVKKLLVEVKFFHLQKLKVYLQFVHKKGNGVRGLFI
jgi:hypothetical protein